jgi:hypothetical protein
MKKVSTKTLMVLTIMVASIMATPTMVAGYDNYKTNSDYTYDQFGIDNPASLITGFAGGFGSLFGGLGSGGKYIGLLFEMLLMQTLTNFSAKETMPGVYVLSATIENTTTGSMTFSGPNSEIYMLPYEYYENFSELNSLGYAYCEVHRSGTYIYNLTKGAAVTLVIWDNDHSFVNAIMKIINFFNQLRPYLSGSSGSEGIPQNLIKEGVELITWFLIHINDIFTGEELFVLNPITWQKLEIMGEPGYTVTKTWKMTGDWSIDNGDVPVSSLSTPYNGTDLLNAWNLSAQTKKDSYMEWLLNENEDLSSAKQTFTSFTFDLIQLWIKNFYISIDVGEIVNLLQGGGSGTVNVAKIFQGLDIEFYLFTHHLTGAFLYNDLNHDDKMSANYVQVNETGTTNPILVNGSAVEVPRSSEIADRLILGDVGDFNFVSPHKNAGKNSISWGLDMNDVSIVPVPIGVDLDAYLSASPELLAYIHFGFTFEPKSITLPTTGGGSVSVLRGAVKLDQEFAPWNDPESYHANPAIAGLDLAIVYVSTVLHFHLTINTIGDNPDDPLNPADDYSNVTHSLRIGNYLPRNIKGKLDFVDIAGKEYLYGSESIKTPDNATTNILPLALFELEANAHKTFGGSENVLPFAADIGLNITFSTMVYAVCYPSFGDGPNYGPGIWHDPTFSVFMVFDAKGFWALILLVAGVGLVGVATILIKRRKDARF